MAPRTPLQPLPAAFVGRTRELAQITAFLERGERLVTILAPAGFGKTRIAERLAAELPCCACDASDSADATDVARHVLEALGVPDGSDPLARVGPALAQRGTTLLVLDGPPSFDPDAGSWLAEWLRAAPGLRLVVTARRRIGLAAEVVFELGPLAGPEAVELLVDRARRVRPSWSPAEPERPLLERIVETLDRIPLAIELAASRTTLLGPAELLSRLSLALDVLPDAPAPERSLRGALEVSWRALSADEQACLRKTAVFRGGFGAAEAEAVIDRSSMSSSSVIDALQALRDHSLLHAYDPGGGPGRLRLGLYRPIREFAAGKLAEAGETEATVRRHLSSYARLAQTAADLESLRLERENLAAALDAGLGDPEGLGVAAEEVLGLLIAFDRALRTAIPVEEHLRRLDAGVVLARRSRARGVVEARVLEARARALRRAGRRAAAIADIEAALAIAQGVRDVALETDLLHQLGGVHSASGELSSARRALERAHTMAARMRDPLREGLVLASLANVAIEQDRIEDAVRWGEQAVQRLRNAGQREETIALFGLGQALREHGQRSSAPELVREALSRFERMGDLWFVAACRLDLGFGHLEEGRADLAREMLQACRQSAIGIDPRLEAVASAALGAADAMAGDLGGARQAFEEAERLHAGLEAAGFAGAVDVLRGLYDVALALAARRRSDGDGEGRHRAEATRRLDVSRGPAAESLDVRRARRILEHALEDVVALAGAAAPAAEGTEALVVHARGDWFATPDGPRVSCRAHRACRRILVRLVQQHLAAPGATLGAEALLATGWPGQRISPTAARNRLHVAVSQLRRMGLGKLLQWCGDGYRIDPNAVVRVAEE